MQFQVYSAVAVPEFECLLLSEPPSRPLGPHKYWINELKTQLSGFDIDMDTVNTDLKDLDPYEAEKPDDAAVWFLDKASELLTTMIKNHNGSDSVVFPAPTADAYRQTSGGGHEATAWMLRKRGENDYRSWGFSIRYDSTIFLLYPRLVINLEEVVSVRNSSTAILQRKPASSHQKSRPTRAPRRK